MAGASDYVGPFANMTLVRGVRLASDETTKELLTKLLIRVKGVELDHAIFREWCDRADGLYYAATVNEKSGADLWPEHETAKVNGRQHVSVNLPAAYVDIPAALQAVEPIEDILATDNTDEARDAASAVERLYTAWKRTEDFELKFGKATTVKGLYGRTAARVYWDPLAEDGHGRPCVEVIQQPRNLYFGWKNDNFDELEWAAFRMFYEPNALTEQFGVEVSPGKDGNDNVPMVFQSSWDDIPSKTINVMQGAKVEVWDYWYREAEWVKGKFKRMKTMNYVVAGNVIIRQPTEYPEYKGTLPYVPLFNTFVPGMPGGRPDLYDIEPLLREEMEAVTRGSQMIANVTRGDSFQLIGPDAPTRVPTGMKPVVGGVIAPGPGNRIEVITPFIAQFQLEQYLGRIDRLKAAVSGLNDLLLGLAPAQVLSSSKAINALIANYESRISMRRKLLYTWRRKVWELSLSVYAEKNSDVKALIARGGGFLEITDPSLSPRDDMETMQRAINAVNNKLWSQRTAMNIVGIDDPETEQDLIREERTDATLFPADVQVMAQLMAALQALNLQPPAGASAQAAGQVASGQDALRQALGAQQNSTGMQSPDTQAMPPAIPGAPAEAQPANASGAPLVTPPDNAPVMQGMIQNGTAKGRIMTQQKLGRR
jgi:hypothetical protein